MEAFRQSGWFDKLRRCLRVAIARLRDTEKIVDSGDIAPSREVVGLAWPIAVSMLGDVAMGLVDTRLVAGLGAAALGGVGVATTMMYLGYAFLFGLMRGVKVRTAHAVGEGRAGVSIAYARAGLGIAVAVGFAMFVLGRDAGWALRLLGVDASLVGPARDFLAARTWGAMSIGVVSAMVQYRQGRGDARTPMLVGLLGNALNAFLAFSLIYGRFGFPALGVRGAGIGTAITETVQAALLLGLLVREARGSEKVRVRELGAALRSVLGLGLPTGMQFGFESLAFLAFTAVISGLGAEQIAAHQVAMAIIRTSFLPGIAVAEAASVLVGNALGERDLARADRVTRASIALAAGFMTACGLVFATCGAAIARSFTDDVDLSTIVRRLLLVAALFQTLDAITIVLRGVLRAAKDVRVVAAIGVGLAWTCIPSAAWFFGRVVGLGALGGWLGFVAETTFAAALFWRRWTRGGWRRAYLEQPRAAGSLALDGVEAVAAPAE
jgi:MATE family multidrug resistance protein